jgi:hypothetical protein
VECSLNTDIAGIDGRAGSLPASTIFQKNEVRDAVNYRAQIQVRLTRLISFDRQNRFDHRDFRVMAAVTSTVWALLVKVDTFRMHRHSFETLSLTLTSRKATS